MSGLAELAHDEATRFAQLCPYCLRPHGEHTLAQIILAGSVQRQASRPSL